MTESFLPILKDADIFYNLSVEQLERIEAICARVTFPQGTIIFQENSFGDDMYIVARGEIEIMVDPAMLGLETTAGAKTVATLRKGQVFGEVAMVDKGLRSASAQVVKGDAHLLVIKRADMMTLCEQDYKLGYMLMRNIAADLAFKIRGADLMVREQLLWRPGELRAPD